MSGGSRRQCLTSSQLRPTEWIMVTKWPSIENNRRRRGYAAFNRQIRRRAQALNRPHPIAEQIPSLVLPLLR